MSSNCMGIALSPCSLIEKHRGTSKAPATVFPSNWNEHICAQVDFDTADALDKAWVEKLDSESENASERLAALLDLRDRVVSRRNTRRVEREADVMPVKR